MSTNHIDQASARAFVHNTVKSAIMLPSARDTQKLPGPSDLADPCDRCLARKIAQACGLPVPILPDRFNLKAWTGTAAHEKLERDLPKIYPQAETEITVPIATIEGLGVIEGHVDVYVPKVLSMVDYKTANVEMIKTFQAVEVPPKHAGQMMLYCFGLILSGRKVEYATLVYIPRDSMKESDIWTASCPYREDIAVGLLNRTRRIVDVVHSRETHKLQPDPSCWNCMQLPKLRGC